MSDTETAALPSKVSYNESDVDCEVAEPSWISGAIVMVFIKEIEYTTFPFTKDRAGLEGTDLAFKIKLGVLDPEDANVPLKLDGLFANANIRLPVKNPDAPEKYFMPIWIRNFWKEFCNGFLPEEHKPVYRRDFESNTEYKAAYKAAAKKRLDEAVEAVEHQGTAYLGNIAYATINRSEGKNGVVYTNFQRFRPQLREGEALSSVEGIYDDGLPKEEVVQPAKKTRKRRKKGSVQEVAADTIRSQ